MPELSNTTSDPSNAITSRWLAAFGVVLGSRALGLAFLPFLVVQAPLALVVMAPMAAYLVLAAPSLDPWVYFGAALASSVTHSAVGYEFGAKVGDKAQVWLEERGNTNHGALMRISRWLERAAPLVLLFMPGPVVCSLAGVARVRRFVFYPTQLIAHALWIAACLWFGSAVTDQLDAVNAFFEAHLLELSIVALLGAGGRYLWKRSRRDQHAVDKPAEPPEPPNIRKRSNSAPPTGGSAGSPVV